MALRGYPTRLASALRTIEEQKELVAKGYSKTLKSNHLAQADGKAWAADLCHITKGWDAPRRFWWLLGANAQARGLGWGGLFGLSAAQRVAVVNALDELRRLKWPTEHEIYHKVKLGWDVAHIELGSNWPESAGVGTDQ